MPPHRTSPTSPFKGGQGSSYARPVALHPTSSPATSRSSPPGISSVTQSSATAAREGLGIRMSAEKDALPSVGASSTHSRSQERSNSGSLYTDVRPPSYSPVNEASHRGLNTLSRVAPSSSSKSYAQVLPPLAGMAHQHQQPQQHHHQQHLQFQGTSHAYSHHQYEAMVPTQPPLQYKPHPDHHHHPSDQHQQQHQQAYQQHSNQPYYSPIAGAVATPPSSSPKAAVDSKSHPIDAGHARAYRSRKDRPCDSCRKRKSRCIIIEAGQNCESCRLNGRSCTFDMDPTPRSRPPKSESQTQRHASNSPSASVGGSLVRFGARDRKVSSASSCLSAAQSTSSPMPAVKPRMTRACSASIRRCNTDALHGIVSRMMTGGSDEVFMEDRSEGHTSDGDRVPQEEEGLMPVVLGSSSSEDPILLKQAERRAMRSTAAMTTNSSDTHRRDQYRNNVNSRRDIVMSNSNDSKEEYGDKSMHNSKFETSTNAPGATSTTAAAEHKDAAEALVPRPLQIRQMAHDPLHPIFFAFVPSHPYGRSQPQAKEIGAEGLRKLRTSLGDKVAPLMALYSSRDSSAFPLLTESQRREYREATLTAIASHRQRRNQSPGAVEGGDAKASVTDGTEVRDEPKIPLPAVLATSTLATATVYDVSLRPISRQAWGYNLHALKEQLDVSTLVTIQVALTDLTGRPSINTSGNFMTFNQTLAIAHMLGLHLDPTSWRVSKEERDVRVRLWWAIVIHDKWSALCWGRPSVIHTSNHSVPLPKRNSLSPCANHLADHGLHAFEDAMGWERRGDMPPDAHTPGDTFAGLCRLTLTLNDVLTDFHSIVPVQELRRDGYVVAQRIKLYMAELEDWKDSMPPTLRAVLRGDDIGARSTESIPGTRSLQLSYLGVNQFVCRTAMDAFTAMGDDKRMLSAYEASLSSAEMIVEYLESLTDEDLSDGFFLHYGSHHIAGSLSLLCRLCLTFSRMELRRLLMTSTNTLSRLLVVLSEAHRLHKWDLAELALTRSRGMLPTLENTIPDFPRFVAPLQGSNSIPQRQSDPSESARMGTMQGRIPPQQRAKDEEDSTVYSAGDAVMAEAGTTTTSVSTSTSGSVNGSGEGAQQSTRASGQEPAWHEGHQSTEQHQQQRLYEQMQHGSSAGERQHQHQNHHQHPHHHQHQQGQTYPSLTGAVVSDMTHLFASSGGGISGHTSSSHSQDNLEAPPLLPSLSQLTPQQQQEVTIDAMGLPFNTGMVSSQGGQSSSHLLPSLEADWLNVMHMGTFPEWPVNANV